MSDALPVEVVLLPRDLRSDQVVGRSVVVYDVLRATTSITAALAAGVREVRIFGDVASAASAAGQRDPSDRLLCGEVNCLPPPGFDLGNSPRAFRRDAHAGRTAFLSTTNGTKAIIAARDAAAPLIGAVVNASAVARRLADEGRPVTLLCAGTQGAVAMEDLLGAGAVLAAMAMGRTGHATGDLAEIARRLFQSNRGSLVEAFRATAGGRNVIAAGLVDDIDFCARLDALDVVGRVTDHPLRVTL